jgi:cobyrinic acid a,c-diamide synthase
MAGVMIAAGWRSSGKTTVSVGLAAALARRGLAVQPFKRGPDFIDPQWLSLAAQRQCRNLDLRLQGAQGVLDYWRHHAAGADIAIVEASQGLHDGLASDGSDSNAALARMLGIPVIVVLDTRGMGRTAAALLMGLAEFDPRLCIAGVILNRVGNARHEARLREDIASSSGLAVLGCLLEDPRLALVERHLGLMPVNEVDDARPGIAALADALEACVDVDAVLAIANGARAIGARAAPHAARASAKASSITLGIARDRAFGFYYPDDLEALRAAGARLVFFDTTRDTRLPAVDGLFIGGGFPEMLAERLEANAPLRGAIRAAIERDMPVYAECGGLMYLARSVTHLGRAHRMVGALPADCVMHSRPVGKGYVTLVETASHPWGRGAGATIPAHEFHYSSLENVDPALPFAYRVARGEGIGHGSDGLVYRNVLASYAHLRNVGGNDWAERFVAFARRHAEDARDTQPLEAQA